MLKRYRRQFGLPDQDIAHYNDHAVVAVDEVYNRNEDDVTGLSLTSNLVTYEWLVAQQWGRATFNIGADAPGTPAQVVRGPIDLGDSSEDDDNSSEDGDD